MRITLFPVVITLVESLSAQYQGWVDRVGPDTISGWAFAPQAASGVPAGRSIWVHLFEGVTYLGSVPSNNVIRPDVQAAYGLPGAWVGFSWTVPSLPPGHYTIHAYVNESIWASTANPIPGASSLIVPSANYTGPSPFGVIENTSSLRVAGWACDPDAAGTPVIVDVFAQFHGVGDPVVVATGPANLPRGDVPCGAGFDIALPALPGGQHGIWVTARNIGSGQDRMLERFTGLAATVTFPFQASYNADPDLRYASSCFQGPGGLVTTACPAWPVPTWSWSVYASAGIPPAPLAPGYQGSPARIRYAGLPGGGLVAKINTYNNAQIPDIFPWDYNFQAIQTRMPQANLSGLTAPTLEVDLAIRNEQDWFLFDPSLLAPSCDPVFPVNGCPNPWLHVITGVVFVDRGNGNGRFLELVPFHRHASSVFGIGGPLQQQNARLPLSDPRVAPHVTLPSSMLVGERRCFRADLRSIARAVWPAENVDNWVITGGYVGTEQYGRIKVALDIRRLSLQWGYVQGSATPFGTACPNGGAPHLSVTRLPTIGSGLGLTVSGTQAPLGVSFLALGFSPSVWNGSALPLDLSHIGMIGCRAYTDVAAVFLSWGSPSADFAVALPWDASLLGLRFYGQAYVPQQAANPAGMAATGGMEFTIGG